MNDRIALGVADVSDGDLAAMIGADEIVGSSARPIDYELETMTTGGRFWVEGDARFADGERPFRLVVKVAQSVTRSPIMAFIPEQFHAMTLQTLPWEVEPEVYRSHLGEVLPDGLRMPAVHAVRDLDDESAAMWIEAIEPTFAWTASHTAPVARLLGRFAASPAVHAIADAVGHRSGPLQARVYFHGRLEGQYLAAYRDGGVFEHPIVAQHYGAGLRERLMELVAVAPGLIDEIEALPLLAAHGDACPNNLLPVDDGFAAIDWAFFGRGRLGFDLTQLVMSEIELGRTTADDLPDRQTAALDAYRDGLAEEGLEIGADALRRAHGIQAAVGIGIAAVPLERLGDDPATLGPLVRERARALDHLLTSIDL